MHHAQLRDVQLVIKGAGDHWQQSARLLIERPKPKIIAVKIRSHRGHRLGEQSDGFARSGRQEIIVNAPRGPDEAVQNMRRWIDHVLFEPQISSVVFKRDSTRGSICEETSEGQMSSVHILRITGFSMRSN